MMNETKREIVIDVSIAKEREREIDHRERCTVPSIGRKYVMRLCALKKSNYI